ncbi:Glutaredoxin [Penicillium atrosanguineum]|nr:Glutaredoxin [Penicillium atrosanguineum]
MSDSTLYLYTSLTAGSSHIVTATARVETILKANKLPFRAIDVATDEAARKLWGRRSKGKKLPGLVKYGNIVGDLEEIEEWNEFGELRMVVNNVQDVDSMPATSNTITPPSQPTPTPKEPETATPKTSTITIQSPPAAKPDEKKDAKAVLALRQASQEAANKAQTKTDEKKPAEGSKSEPKPELKNEIPTQSRAHRGSVAPELPDTVSDSPKAAKRPPLIPEVAAVSSANFHADNAEMLGLVEHHRGSIISTIDQEEQEKVVSDIRKSITAEDPSGNLDALRKEAAQKAEEGTIEEVATPLEEDIAAVAPEIKDVHEAEASKEDVKQDVKEEADAKDDVKGRHRGCQARD